MTVQITCTACKSTSIAPKPRRRIVNYEAEKHFELLEEDLARHKGLSAHIQTRRSATSDAYTNGFFESEFRAIAMQLILTLRHALDHVALRPVANHQRILRPQ